MSGRAKEPLARAGLILLLAFAALCLAAGAEGASAVTQAQVSAANGQVESAFAAAYHAEARGANVSSLVSQLNQAVQLVQNAEAENATDPGQSAADLANATQMAQSVGNAAGPAGQEGAALRQLQLYASAAEAAAIVAAAGCAYALGGRAYRLAWLRVYRRHLVKRVG